MVSATVVVARYKESIEWTKQIPSDFDVVVYDKGSTVENIGRESHTYLKYIVDTYDRLPDVVVFTQAHPFDHVKEASDIPMWFTRWKKWISATGLSYNFVPCDWMNFFDWTCSHFPDSEFRVWFRKYVDDFPENKFPLMFAFNGACFGVSRERILLRSKEYYERLLEQHTETFSVEPYFMERAWFYIFKGALSLWPVDARTVRSLYAIMPVNYLV